MADYKTPIYHGKPADVPPSVCGAWIDGKMHGVPSKYLAVFKDGNCVALCAGCACWVWEDHLPYVAQMSNDNDGSRFFEVNAQSQAIMRGQLPNSGMQLVLANRRMAEL
jgi:hypothetical protein